VSLYNFDAVRSSRKYKITITTARTDDAPYSYFLSAPLKDINSITRLTLSAYPIMGEVGQSTEPVGYIRTGSIHRHLTW